MSTKSKHLPSVNIQNGPVVRSDHSQKQQMLEQNGSCCGKDGICSHEVLGREGSASELNLLEENKMSTKV